MRGAPLKLVRFGKGCFSPLPFERFKRLFHAGVAGLAKGQTLDARLRFRATERTNRLNHTRTLAHIVNDSGSQIFEFDFASWGVYLSNAWGEVVVRTSLRTPRGKRCSWFAPQFPAGVPSVTGGLAFATLDQSVLCHKRDVLFEDYRHSVDRLSEAVMALTSGRQRPEFDALYRDCEKARVACTEAHQLLDKHRHEHGC